MDNRVVIRYMVDIAAGPNQPAHLAGETFVVTDAAIAKALHPHAEIVSYANGQKFVAAKDESVQGVKEAIAPDTNKKSESKPKTAEKDKE